MSSFQNHDIIITEDGSNSVFSNVFNENYHSTHGAIQESRHIFIEAGFNIAIKNKNEINILEIGFGTGLNALLTLIETKDQSTIVNYTSFELFPLPEKIFKALNFAKLLKRNNEIFLFLHNANWNEMVQINEKFILLKLNQDILKSNLTKNKFDLIYFDAFSPEIQPELWTENIFLKLFRSMKENAVLITYSAKGSVKRAMKSAGFVIESLQGPTGKREITRAKKIEIIPNNL